MNVRQITRLGLLTAAALILFIVELRFPSIIPVPGIKLGLANIVTVYAVFRFTPGETAMMVFARVLLGAMFSGNFSALIYSASGAFLCLLGMLALRGILPQKQIWLCSVIGAMLHNIGQVLAAAAVMRSWAVAAYLPILLVAGSVAGLVTGLAAQLILSRTGSNKL
ncbi:MAG: Gx transporter family protein [Oscillospiraceae bacterium]|nr:Gx transporter family protein [Oscillospiraceae bacterium]